MATGEVVAGIVKTIAVEAGLALPGDVAVRRTR
jgi:hypothetical protein